MNNDLKNFLGVMLKIGLQNIVTKHRAKREKAHAPKAPENEKRKEENNEFNNNLSNGL